MAIMSLDLHLPTQAPPFAPLSFGPIPSRLVLSYPFPWLPITSSRRPGAQLQSTSRRLSPEPCRHVILRRAPPFVKHNVPLVGEGLQTRKHRLSSTPNIHCAQQTKAREACRHWDTPLGDTCLGARLTRGASELRRQARLMVRRFRKSINMPEELSGALKGQITSAVTSKLGVSNARRSPRRTSSWR